MQSRLRPQIVLSGGLEVKRGGRRWTLLVGRVLVVLIGLGGGSVCVSYKPVWDLVGKKRNGFVLVHRPGLVRGEGVPLQLGGPVRADLTDGGGRVIGDGMQVTDIGEQIETSVNDVVDERSNVVADAKTVEGNHAVEENEREKVKPGDQVARLEQSTGQLQPVEKDDHGEQVAQRQQIEQKEQMAQAQHAKQVEPADNEESRKQPVSVENPETAKQSELVKQPPRTEQEKLAEAAKGRKQGLQQAQPHQQHLVTTNETQTSGPAKVNPYVQEQERDPADFGNFGENTSLIYFHLHKTGGVSFKERLYDFFGRVPQRNRHGKKAVVADTCYMSGPARPALGIEAQWSCDWGAMANKTEKERNQIDVVVGHQYWEKGAGYWLPNRDLRYFTVMRHPLHRKISFYYHFFARNAGRSEDDVRASELIQFVLGREMPSSPLVRDAGPGYYASRLWSDGWKGFNKMNRYEIKEEEAGGLVYSSIRRLRRNFVFIGLQTQELASLCMLKKVVEGFAEAHGFRNMTNLDKVAQQRQRLNTGSYGLTAPVLWGKMTREQKEEYKKVERVDLAIYKESVEIFGEMVKRFECSHLVVDVENDDIALP